MGFLDGTLRRERAPTKGVSLELLHRHECQVCTLNRAPLKNPKMLPSGSSKPLVYMLGEAPNEQDDRRGEAFVGPAGQALRFRIPKSWLQSNDLRWSNTIRCRPPNNRDPSPVELACCQPRTVKDIEESKPAAIFGFGNVPLAWIIGEAGISKWRGKRLPVQIGSHRCWYYPMLAPSYILDLRKFEPKKTSDYGSDAEFAFAIDLKNAFAEVDAGLPEPIVHTAEMARADVEIVTGERGDADLDKLQRFFKAAAMADVAGVDVETKRTRPYARDAKLLTAAVSVPEGSMAFALDHPENGWTSEQREKAWEIFGDFLHKSKCRKAVHNLAYELEWFVFWFGRDVVRASPWADTIAQAFVLDERQGTLSLEFLCWQHFGINVKELSPVFDKNNLDREPLKPVLTYNAIDAKYHRLLYHSQRADIIYHGLQDVYAHHLRRVKAVTLTQLKGVPIDQAVVADFYKLYDGQLGEIEKAIAELPDAERFRKAKGYDFRPSAPKDLEFTIQKILGIQGVESTQESALSGIKAEIVQKVLEWRGVNKLFSTYVKPLVSVDTATKLRLEEFDEHETSMHPDGLIHPILSTTKTRTWRTASEDPSSQNFPKHEHREVRKQMKHAGGKKFVSIDYAGIQARNIAMESGDKTLIQAFWDRYDIHTDWMEKIEKRVPGWIKIEGDHDKKYWRNRAKNGFVFPSFFGALAKKTAGELGIAERDSEYLREQLWDMFPDVLKWQKRLKDGYYRDGYVTGLSGFRRHAPVGINELINAPIQADEAIIVCTAMADLSELEEPRFQANMEIHDDLTFCWDKHEIERNLETVVPIMVNTPYEWAHVVPIGIEVSIGDDWESLKGVGEYFSDLYKGDLFKGNPKLADALK